MQRSAHYPIGCRSFAVNPSIFGCLTALRGEVVWGSVQTVSQPEDDKMVAVSIGMPVYNSAKFVRAAIEQLQAQTFPDFELLVSDNHSTDGTWEICQEIAEKDTRIKLFRHEQNIGVFKNFAAVLERATAPYFMWAADDDWHHPNFLRRCHDALIRNRKAGLAFCHFTVFNHENDVRSPVIEPIATIAENPTDTLTVRLTNPMSNLFYGLMQTRIAHSYFPHEYFDWADAFMIAEISLEYDIEIVPETLYGAGIKTAIRKPTAANGKSCSAEEYLKRSIVRLFETVPSPDDFRLLGLVHRQTTIMDAETMTAEMQYRKYEAALA